MLEQLEEQPLGPAVVLRVGGVKARVPVSGDRVTLERFRLGVDVLVGPLGRMLVVLDRSVFRRQAEGVPADRVENVVALVQPVARYDVADCECLGVAHVEVTRWVREHVEDILTLA